MIGVIDLQGVIIPVFNVRKRFNLVDRGVRPADQMIIATATGRTVGLAVDDVIGVVERPAEEVIDAAKILPQFQGIQGVVQTDDGLILIHDLDQFLSTQEAAKLEQILAEK